MDDVSVSGNFLIISDQSNGLSLYSVDQEYNLELVSNYQPWNYVNDTMIRGNKLYIKDYHGTIEVVDVRLPSNPKQIMVDTSHSLYCANCSEFAKAGTDFVVRPIFNVGLQVFDLEPVDEQTGDDDDDIGPTIEQWDAYGYYVQGQKIRHNGSTWVCVQTHQCYGDLNWAPGIAPSPWTLLE